MQIYNRRFLGERVCILICTCGARRTGICNYPTPRSSVQNRDSKKASQKINFEEEKKRSKKLAILRKICLK